MDWPGERRFGWECSPTTLIALTTSYFSSQNYSTVETGGLPGDQGLPSSKRHMVVSPSMKSKRKQHSWLSSIVGACCKSNETTRAERHTEKKGSGLRPYPLPETTNENLIVQVGQGWNWYNQVPAPEFFPSTSEKSRSGPHFSPRSFRRTSQIKSNPPSSPSCLDWTQWGFLLQLCMTSDSDCHVETVSPFSKVFPVSSC